MRQTANVLSNVSMTACISLFDQYMRDNTAAVAVVSLISTTNVAALEFLSSKVFDIDATKAPMTGSALDMIQMGGVASVLFEGKMRNV